MEPNKILSANILDLIFDDRNKEYGAYELRATYPQRIKKALILTGSLAALIFGGTLWANSLRPKQDGFLTSRVVELTAISQEEKKDEPIIELKKKEPEPQVRTEKLTDFKMVDKDIVEPPPTQEDLQTAVIDVKPTDGLDYTGVVEPKELDDNKGIIEENKNVVSNEPFTTVEIDAKFNGNWEKFLRQNLDPSMPGQHGAPTGRYTVLVQFVVDIDGNVSDIKALTSHGYGLEQEAIRVIRKSKKWEPAFQNKQHVKAYRTQPITFDVVDE
ncbi:MAG: TonB family protein [Chitinophagaceae bacterium]|nr:TonB family protein [Chitinophagaceae bacterium]